MVWLCVNTGLLLVSLIKLSRSENTVLESQVFRWKRQSAPVLKSGSPSAPVLKSASHGDINTLISEVFGPEDGRKEEQTVPDQSGGSSDCQCVVYYLCNNDTLVTDGTGVIDIRIKDGPCENYLDVCCPTAPLTPHEIPPERTPPPFVRHGCGHRNKEGVGFRIIGDMDSEAQFGEFPWMVAILREEEVDDGTKLNVYQCGGSLIHEQVVLTAAHCVVGKLPQHLKVRAGEWDTQTKNELLPHQDRNVVEIKVHEDYYAGALYNDIALVFLAEPFHLAENIDTVCLPPQGDVMDHSKCTASGWGKDVFGKEGRYQVILKKVDLPIVPYNYCLNKLRKTRLGQNFNLHESFICAGGEPKKDTCKGDGGSPLACPIPEQPDRYKQAGIVAWGIGCGNDTPGVYANVALFRDWIDALMTHYHYDTSSYTY